MIQALGLRDSSCKARQDAVVAPPLSCLSRTFTSSSLYITVSPAGRLVQAEAQRRKAAVRGAELAAVRGSGPALLRLLREAAARAGYLFADHTRNALILSVFAFKVFSRPDPVVACFPGYCTSRVYVI